MWSRSIARLGVATTGFTRTAALWSAPALIVVERMRDRLDGILGFMTLVDSR